MESILAKIIAVFTALTILFFPSCVEPKTGEKASQPDSSDPRPVADTEGNSNERGLPPSISDAEQIAMGKGEENTIQRYDLVPNVLNSAVVSYSPPNAFRAVEISAFSGAVMEGFSLRFDLVPAKQKVKGSRLYDGATRIFSPEIRIYGELGRLEFLGVLTVQDLREEEMGPTEESSYIVKVGEKIKYGPFFAVVEEVGLTKIKVKLGRGKKES